MHFQLVLKCVWLPNSAVHWFDLVLRVIKAAPSNRSDLEIVCSVMLFLFRVRKQSLLQMLDYRKIGYSRCFCFCIVCFSFRVTLLFSTMKSEEMLREKA